MSFGAYIRNRREALKREDSSLSLRGVARQIGVEPSFLSKVERDAVSPPSEHKIFMLAAVLGEDPDYLLALAGRVSSELQSIIRHRPRLFARLIRELKDLPDRALDRLMRQVRQGDW